MTGALPGEQRGQLTGCHLPQPSTELWPGQARQSRVVDSLLSGHFLTMCLTHVSIEITF